MTTIAYFPSLLPLLVSVVAGEVWRIHRTSKMHIKQIIIENFKSYKGRHVLDELNPRHNAIVGRNGSGKSSLLDSITFVLSNRYHPITKEQRKAIVNDDLQNPARSASVELILVDPDNLLSFSTPEVRIRREIFPDSDNIIINEVRFPHSELFNLLSSVFPRENPYYIVRQDEVAHLATATDSARFNVISTTVGVHKFEQELDKLLEEIAKKEILLKEKRLEIESRREKLRTMNEKYNRWHKKNKIKRYLQHRLCELNQNSLAAELSTLDERYEVELKKFSEAKTKYDSLNDEYLNLRTEVSSIQSDIDHLEEIKRKVRNRSVELSDELNSLELEEKEIIEKLQGVESGEVVRFTRHKENLDCTILDFEDKCKTTKKKVDEARETIERTGRELKRCEYQAVAQSRRKARVLQLQSGDEEEESVTVPRLSQYDEEIRGEEKIVAEGEANVKKAEEQKTRLGKDLETKRSHRNAIKVKLRNHKNKKEDFQKVRDDLLAQRKDKQREADELHDNIENLIKTSATMKRRLQSVIRSDIFEGIESVKKIVEEWRQQDRDDDVAGVNGLLLDLFECTQPSVSFPMEIRGGEQLFHHIVRDRRIVSQITNEMKEQKLGGIVHFIPLGDITVPKAQYPENQNEWKPIVSFLNTNDENSKKAVDFVFGNTGIVRDLSRGINIAKYQNLQSITLDGQQVLGKGKFRGGYRDKNFSRVDYYKKFIETRDELEKLKSDYERRLSEIQKINHELLSPINELQKLEVMIYDDEQHISQLQIEIAEASRALEDSTDDYNCLKIRLESSKVRLEETKHEKSNMTLEGQDLNVTLQEIDRSMEELRRESVSLEQEKKRAEMDITCVEELNYLNKILSKLHEERDKLEDRKREFSEDFLKERRLSIEGKKEKCRKNLKDLEKKLEEINIQLNELRRKLPGLIQPLKKMELKAEEAQLLYEETKEDSEVIGLKRDSLKQEIDEWKEKDGQLGTIPNVKNSEHFDTLNKKALEIKIRELTKQEKSIGIVAEVSDRIELLKEELIALKDLQREEEEAKRAYEREMQRINRKKVRALKIGFRVINGYFSEIFGEIVANGRACLYPVDNDGEELLGEVDWNRVRGIRIRATFVGDQEMHRMYQFSGGQKTLIALTLIFAVHKYRPIPFYLFDEIDKALDGNYRASVAGFVHRLSRETQFLTVTFKGEMLMQADKYFKVTVRNNCSYVSDSTRKEAVGFVGRDAGEE